MYRERESALPIEAARAVDMKGPLIVAMARLDPRHRQPRLYFQLANSAPPPSVTDSATAPSAKVSTATITYTDGQTYKTYT